MGRKDDAWVKPNHLLRSIIKSLKKEKCSFLDLIKNNITKQSRSLFLLFSGNFKRRGDANSFLEYMQHYILDPPEKTSGK